MGLGPVRLSAESMKKQAASLLDGTTLHPPRLLVFFCP